MSRRGAQAMYTRGEGVAAEAASRRFEPRTLGEALGHLHVRTGLEVGIQGSSVRDRVY